jgi:hypothetical protein
LINKRLLLSKAFSVFACFHAPFVFVLDLIQTFDVLVKGAYNATPRVVWGSGRLRSPLGRFEGLDLTG